MAEKWEAQPTSYRMSYEHSPIWAVTYCPEPNGRKNEDGTTSISLRFPALIVSEYAKDGDKVAADVARQLNTYGDILAALKAMLQAVGGKTGFAAAVRSHSGLGYPWPALDAAEELAADAIAKAEAV